VPQVYVARSVGDRHDFVPRLAGFTRLHLEPGETQTVTLDLEPRILAHWDGTVAAFRIAGGRYDVRLGGHALDQDGPAQSIELTPAVLS
jgi:beta-glucosidase